MEGDDKNAVRLNSLPITLINKTEKSLIIGSRSDLIRIIRYIIVFLSIYIFLIRLNTVTVSIDIKIQLKLQGT
jgi:hypothetical protein